MKYSVPQLLEKIALRGNGLFEKDFLLSWEKDGKDLSMLIEVAFVLKQMREQGISARVFDSGLAVSNFRDKSTRTRFSFASAANLLGLAVQDLDEEKSQISHGETVRETAAMISFLTDCIGIRDDMYLGEGHRYMKEVAASLDESHKKGVLSRRPVLVNLQCDLDHPTQSLADLAHLQDVFGSLEALKGKKIAMSWAYSPSYGKPLSVPQGIIGLFTRFGMDVHLAHPKGYELLPEVVEMAGGFAKDSGGSFVVSNSMDDAVEGAHIVYPKSWAPLEIMKSRTRLLKQGDREGLKDLETDCLKQNAAHKDWEYDTNKRVRTHGGDALYMHCLPADISGVSCPRGEVTAEEFERYRIQTYREAGFKPYIIAAMILTAQYREPHTVLHHLYTSNKNRMLYV